jgi:hypothetical protein
MATAALDAVKSLLRRIAVDATCAAEALEAAAVDFLPPDLARLAAALDAVSERLNGICERLSAGVDPSGPASCRHHRQGVASPRPGG